VLSQVALSFGIPFALVPLVLLTSRGDVMGAMVNRRATVGLAVTATALILSLNVYLLGVVAGVL
jgi:manganese transport protein